MIVVYMGWKSISTCECVKHFMLAIKNMLRRSQHWSASEFWLSHAADNVFQGSCIDLSTESIFRDMKVVPSTDPFRVTP